MKIKLERDRTMWRADLLDLPGSPPVGMALTKEGAVASLFLVLLTTADNFFVQWLVRHSMDQVEFEVKE